MKDQLMAMIHTFPWPFLVIKDLPKEKVYLQRMMETVVSAILISSILGGFGGYLLLQVLNTKFEDNKEFMAEKFRALQSDVARNADTANKNSDRIYDLGRQVHKLEH